VERRKITRSAMRFKLGIKVEAWIPEAVTWRIGKLI
jgi:hypothetical protein